MSSGEILYIGEDEGPTCLICGEIRPEATEVACEECGTLHHRDCWEYVGSCSIFGCPGRRWVPPREGEVIVLQIDESTPTPNLPQVARPRGTNVPSARANTGADAPVPRSMMVKSRAVNLTGHRVRLDLDTPLENTIGVLAALGFVFALGLLEAGSLALYPLAFGVFMTFVWANADCTYLVDNDTRCLDYRRKVLAWEEEYPIAAFQDILIVTTRGTFHTSKHSRWWEYRPVAVLRNGAILELTDGVRNNLDVADDNARAFARHVDARYVPGQAERELKVHWGPGPVRVEHRPRRGLLAGLFD